MSNHAMVQKITATPNRRTERRRGRGGVSVRTPVEALLPALAQRAPISSGDHESPARGNVIGVDRSLCPTVVVLLRTTPARRERAL